MTSGEWNGRPASADTVKKKLTFQGIPIHVDRPKGFIMRGVDKAGKAWKREYQVDYGFIPKTLGGDGDGIDVFLGPDADAAHAYWVTQKKADGTFDEYKVMLGWPDKQSAMDCYRAHIPGRFADGLAVISVDFMKAMLGLDPVGTAKTAMVVASMLAELDRSGAKRSP